MFLFSFFGSTADLLFNRLVGIKRFLGTVFNTLGANFHFFTINGLVLKIDLLSTLGGNHRLTAVLSGQWSTATNVAKSRHKTNFIEREESITVDRFWQVRYHKNMFLSLIYNNPALGLAWIAAILIALTVHEFSHALAAKYRGDRSAERAGRLTLNPLAHIDWMGFIPLLLLGFGWAKPVPYNPYNLKNPKWDSVIIGLAGPLSNLIMAVAAGLSLRIIALSGAVTEFSLLIVFLFLLVLINLFLMFFNLVPIAPLDGSKLFFALFDAPQYAKLREFVAIRGPQILLVLVLIAIITSIPVFAFVSIPSFATCSVLLGEDCSLLLAIIFNGI